MSKIKLTKKWIDAEPLSKKEKVYWDTENQGFGLRISATKKVFIVQGRVNRKTRKVTLGRYGHITLSEARDMAKDELLKMAKGIDPSVTRQIEKIKTVTLEQVVESYLKAKSLKPLSIKDINHHLILNFKDWKKRPMAGITRQEIKSKFQELCERSPAQANQGFRLFRAWWNYARSEYRDVATDEPVFPENPVLILSEQNLWGKVKPRNGKIPIEKVGQAWNTLKELMDSPVQTPIGRTIVDATAFILLTGCRLSEAAKLTWDRVDPSFNWWRIDDPKNTRPITLPLSNLAGKILKERPRVNNFVFDSKSQTGHILEVRTPLKKISSAIGVSVAAHDLRRTFLSIALHNEIELWKAKLLLNHQESNVTIKHYVETSDLRNFKPEVDLMASWIIEQAKIATAGNIVVFPNKKQA